MKLNLYKILGISRSAGPEEIRSAYRTLARRLHPDQNVEAGETELFLGVQNAYEILSDPVKRAEYDQNLTEEFEERASVSISTTYSRSSLTRINAPQLIYVLFELIPHVHTSKEGAPPLNLCLVLDVSTSMQGRFLDMVKTTATRLIRELRKQDFLSIVTFSDRADVLVPSGPVQDPKGIEMQVQMLSTSGGTEIFRGLEKGYEQIIRHRSDKRINHIFLVTDGRTYGDEQDCILLARKAADQGIGISGLGIGNKWNDDFLDELTAISGGNSLFVSKPTEILYFLSEKFLHLNQRVAQNVTCDFNLEKGVELQYAYRLQPDAAPLRIESPTALGSIQENLSLKVLMELKVHDLENVVGEKVLLEGRLSLEIPAHNQPREAYQLIFMRPTSFEYTNENVAPDIVDALSKLTLYRMQERARKEISEGTTSSAAIRLQRLATQLLARGETDLAGVVLNEATGLEQNNSISEEGEKRIKYGTRNLLLPEFLEDRT